MTVKELIEALAEFPDDAEVNIEAWYETEDNFLNESELRCMYIRSIHTSYYGLGDVLIETEQP